VLEVIHTNVVPVITAGIGLTVMVATVLQPVAVIVYVMSTTPAATPVTTPLEEPTVAVALLLLAHVPPDVASLRVIVEPSQTVDEPAIAVGTG
jgi:hypothetical protein